MAQITPVDTVAKVDTVANTAVPASENFLQKIDPQILGMAGATVFVAALMAWAFCSGAKARRGFAPKRNQKSR